MVRPDGCVGAFRPTSVSYETSQRPSALLGPLHRVGRRAPGASGDITHHDITGSARAGEIRYEAGETLTATVTLWVGQHTQANVQILDLDRAVAVELVPESKELNQLDAARIVAFDVTDAPDGIGATERDQRIATPASPAFEAAERQAALDVVPTPPPPDCQNCGEELTSLALDSSSELASKGTQLGIFAARIEIHGEKAPCQVLGYAQRVTGDRKKCIGGNLDELRVLAKRPNGARVLRDNLGKQVGTKNLGIDVVDEDQRLGGDEGSRQSFVQFRPVAGTGEGIGRDVVGDARDRADELPLAGAGPGELRRTDNKPGARGKLGRQTAVRRPVRKADSSTPGGCAGSTIAPLRAFAVVTASAKGNVRNAERKRASACLACFSDGRSGMSGASAPTHQNRVAGSNS